MNVRERLIWEGYSDERIRLVYDSVQRNATTPNLLLYLKRNYSFTDNEAYNLIDKVKRNLRNLSEEYSIIDEAKPPTPIIIEEKRESMSLFSQIHWFIGIGGLIFRLLNGKEDKVGW